MISLTLLVCFRKDIERSFSIDYLFLRRFILTFFFFNIVNFLIYYNEYFMLSGMMGKGFLVLFDILLVLTSFFCIQLNALPWKGDKILFIISGLVYILAWAFVYFIDFTTSPYLFSIIELLADAFYCSIIGGIMVINIFYQKEHNADIWEQQYLVTADIMITVYVAFLYCADLFFNLTAAYSVKGAQYPYLYDPVPLISMVVNIFTIVYLTKKLRIVRQGTYVAERVLKEFNGSNANLFNLTDREQEVAELVVKGLGNLEIAENLCISPNTVKRHMNNIFKKVNVKNRFELYCVLQKKLHEKE